MASLLRNLINKKTRTVIGVSSGTSADGIDTAIVRISGSGTAARLRVVDFHIYPMPDRIRKTLLKMSGEGGVQLSEVCRLNVILGRVFAESVNKIRRRNGRIKIDLIGSHGQTIQHLPKRGNFLGYKTKSTLQIGDPSIIANLTGISAVGDFRIADCAAGGDGAPLVPYLDYVLFRSHSINRGLLNIGGIANLTVIPKRCAITDVIGFDTGPGNMIIDGLMNKLFKKNYDRNGSVAARGIINYELFKWLLKDTYFKRSPPKSTGRERYGSEFQNRILQKAKNVKRQDIIKTVTEFTAYCVGYNYHRFVKRKTAIDELIISGGGSRNKEMVRLIRNYMQKVGIREVDDFGITSDSKEAVLFAVLANECINGNSANMPSVTGASKNVILGKICLA